MTEHVLGEEELKRLVRGVCAEAMELLKDAPGAAAMFDPDYVLSPRFVTLLSDRLKHCTDS